MAENELLNKYCTTLYRIGRFAFTNKEDAQNFLEAQFKWELRGYSHGVIHIPLGDAEGDYSFDQDVFIDEMGSITEISYNDEEYDSLSYAYFDDDPEISSEDKLEIESWIKQYKKLVEDIKKVFNSTYVEIDYDEDDFVIRGTKYEVEALFYAMYGDEGWVERESLKCIEDLDEDNLISPWRVHNIKFKGEYFEIK